MPRLRHLALLTENPERLAEFYRTVFEMKEVGRSPGAIYLSDGHTNLSLITKMNIPDHQRPTGIYHFGFHIEELEAVQERLRKAGIPDAAPPRPRDGRYAEHRVKDPDGNLIDLAEHDWQV
jgi:catechol 2,3-dioxygenase-like lactoylglutathione lyase family enzyme